MDDHTSNITEQHTAGNAQIGTGRCLSYFYSDHVTTSTQQRTYCVLTIRISANDVAYYAAVSTKLIYAEPVSSEMGDRWLAAIPSR